MSPVATIPAGPSHGPTSVFPTHPAPEFSDPSPATDEGGFGAEVSGGVGTLPVDLGGRVHEWSTADGGAIRAVVMGGFEVDVDDLGALAVQIDHVADTAERAQGILLAAGRQVVAGVVPLGEVPDTLEGVNLSWQRSLASTAIEHVTSAQSGIPRFLESARGLALAVRQAAQAYMEAEAQAGKLFDLDMSFLAGASAGMAMRHNVLLALLADSGAAGYLLEKGDFTALGLEGMPADVLDQLRVVLADPGLAAWARRDLLALVAVAMMAKLARTGSEQAQVEAYLRTTAARLDPEISKVLPEQLPRGSEMVAREALTPMQRVSAYLAFACAGAGAQRFGARTGLRITPHGGRAIIMPPGFKDPFGLGTPMSRITGPNGGVAPVGGVVKAPATPSDVMRYSDSLKKRDADTSSGVISLLRTDHADGRRSWLVVVPGTTNWGVGGSNPQDMLTNLEAVGRVPTDMESAVVTAMRSAGVGRGEEVMFYGHSQGAITAANVAGDPAITSRYRVSGLLTVGGPVSGVELPRSINALHVENMADPVPALDALPNPAQPHRTTVAVDTTRSGIEGYPHGSLVYAAAMDGMPNDPAVSRWSEGLRAVTGAGEEGATTREIIFDIERVTGR